MQKQTVLTITFFVVSYFLGACSGKRNHQRKPQSGIQQEEQTTADNQSSAGEAPAEGGKVRPNDQAAGRSGEKDKKKGIFTFQINNEKYTATTVNPAMYEEVSDTSSVLGIIATYKKPDHSAVVISLNLQLKKEGLKPDTYTLGDAKIDETPYKGIYMKKNKKGLMYYGYSKKGTVTITDHHKVKGSDHSIELGDQKVTNAEGKVSGHFTFTGKVVLTTTMANNPPEKPFTAKGTFDNISLRETHSSADK